MAKYQAGDRAVFGGKVVVLEEASGSSGAAWGDKPLQAREEATGLLMGKVRGEYQLSPAPVGQFAVEPIKVQIRPEDRLKVNESLEALRKASYQYQAPVYRIADLIPISAGYSEQIGDLVHREIQRSVAGMNTAAPPKVVVNERNGTVQVDMEIRTNDPMDPAYMERQIRRSIERQLDRLLASPATVEYLSIKGTIGEPAHRCSRCNAEAKPAYQGFFEAEPEKCLRFGGCLADARPEVSRQAVQCKERPIPGTRIIPFREPRSESLFVARGNGAAVRHPLQDVAVALWHETVMARAWGRQPSRQALAASIL
jgi:hypothetical protein